MEANLADRRVGARGCQANATVTVAFALITLVEIWCSTGSSFAKAVAQMGGAALRVCWPPPRPGRKKARRGRKAAVGRPLDQETPPSEAPKLKAGSKPKVWFLNLDWESHRAALLAFLRVLKPAPRTRSLHIHTSPPCHMFANPQRLNIGRGIFNWDNHATALVRLRFARSIHRILRGRRKALTCTCVSSHEQSLRSSVDLVKDYDPDSDFPWAVGKRMRRVPVNGCMVGRVSDAGLPVYKGWDFECDSVTFLKGLKSFHCAGGHQHHPTIWSREEREDPQSALPQLSTRSLENYTPYLGCLLAASSSARTSR